MSRNPARRRSGCRSPLTLEPLESRAVPTAVPFGATNRDTSEFMIGTAVVDVVLFESTGQIDPDTETWTAEQLVDMQTRAVEGLTWWTDTLAAQGTAHSINFDINLQYAATPIFTPYEPISRPTTEMELWVNSFLDVVGANTAAAGPGPTYR